MTAGRSSRRRVSTHVASLGLVVLVLLGLAAMHGGPSAGMSAGNHGPMPAAALAPMSGSPGATPGHGPEAGMTASSVVPAPVGAGGHHSMMAGCALALTGIAAFALSVLVRRRVGVAVSHRSGRWPRSPVPPSWARASPPPMARFSLCVLRT